MATGSEKATVPGRLGMALAVAALLALSACGYALAGRGSNLPSSIRTIGIPMFVNNTQLFDIERVLTERVRQEFISRGRFEVVPTGTGADAVLTGQIVSVTVAPTAFNAQQQATRYAIALTTRIEFRDVKADKILWENQSLLFREEYDVATVGSVTDPAAFFGQDQNARERVATNFARSVVSSILEAF
jgi:outer membrane lipopolysaccharide assembly protein LptE/RlpB